MPVNNFPIVVRRVRHSEIDQIIAFCESKYAEPSPFLKHSGWLLKVRRELSAIDNTRVAFGAFCVRKGSWGLDTKYDMVGCLFLKRSGFDDIVELKNLICANIEYLNQYFDSLNPIERMQNIVKEVLIEKAIRYCEIREVPRIEMELLQEYMTKDVALLIQMGFSFSAVREKYGIGNYVYILEKYVGDTYQADPFDEEKVIKWLIRTAFQSSIETAQSSEIALTAQPIVVKRVQFKIRSETPTVKQLLANKNISETIKETFIIKGELLVINDVDENSLIKNYKLAIEYFTSESKVRYILSNCIEKAKNNKDKNYSPTIYELFMSHNISVITYQELTELAGGSKSSLAIPIKLDEVGGFITVLERKAIEELAKHSRFKYYLVSGIGNSIYPDNRGRFILSIYCPHWDNSRSHGLIGFAEIINSVDSTFEEAHKLFPEAYPALTKDELLHYKKNSIENERIKVLECSKIIYFPIVVTVSDFESSLSISRVANMPKSKDMNEFDEHYISHELINNLASSAYIDQFTANYITNMVQ